MVRWLERACTLGQLRVSRSQVEKKRYLWENFLMSPIDLSAMSGAYPPQRGIFFTSHSSIQWYRW